MPLPTDQLDELRKYWPAVQVFEDGGQTYPVIPVLGLPSGCTPVSADALVCAHHRDGYPCRVFFSQVIRSREQRNWNHTNVWIGGRSWNAFSWQIGPGPHRLAQIVRAFLKGLE